MRFLLLVSFLFSFNYANAHEMTPTYPEFRRSFIEGIYLSSINIFNRRIDIEYYEIDVFDEEWNFLSFATESKIVKIKYLHKKTIDIYLKEEDLDKVTYICSRSKILKNSNTTSMISSKICSKVNK